jgi:hypothetical protein
MILTQLRTMLWLGCWLATYLPLLATCLPLPVRAQTPTANCIQDYTNGPPTCGPWTPKVLSALTATLAPVKSSSGQLGPLYCTNSNASIIYLQFFDAATASAVTLGSTTPSLSIGFPMGTFGIPPSSIGFGFNNGIEVAATATATGSGAPAATLTCSVGIF